MTPILSTNIAGVGTSPILLIAILDIQGISPIKMISPLMITVSLSAEWAYVCTRMRMKMQNIGQNTATRKQAANKDVSVNNPVPLPNMAGRYTFTSNNPRLFSIPPRDSTAWKKEYDTRTFVERSNKCEREDYKLEDGRHRSIKMWHCCLYSIMSLRNAIC